MINREVSRMRDKLDEKEVEGMHESYIVLDIETTGISPTENKITEIGAVKIINGQVVDRYEQLINPQVAISEHITSITGITNEMVADQPTIEVVLPQFITFLEDHIIVGHNIMFDYKFLKINASKLGLAFEKKAMDTLAIARKTLRNLTSRSLESLCLHYEINRERGHRAYDDAYATYELLTILYDQFHDVNQDLFVAQELIYKMPKLSPITPKQKRFLSQLISLHQVNFEENIDTLTKSQASKAIDKILHKYGRKTS